MKLLKVLDDADHHRRYSVAYSGSTGRREGLPRKGGCMGSRRPHRPDSLAVAVRLTQPLKLNTLTLRRFLHNHFPFGPYACTQYSAQHSHVGA